VPADSLQLNVVVCYATARQELLREVRVEQGATIGTAIAASHILDDIVALAAAGTLDALADPRDPGSVAFDPAVHQVGIFGKKKPLDTVLREGDRVELYRPLLADPKETRRRRAGPRTLKRDS
jgi:putative ubiquitin-RnfH superfamily antitoxin RatB of RatAB toxin-antitoxin module